MKQLFFSLMQYQMKLIHIYIIISFCSCSQDVSWKYLGQKPPGLKPQIFAPGIISGIGRIHCFPSFSTDGKEIVWMELPPKILYVKYENAKWSEPKVADFSIGNNSIRPIHSYDNKRIYFASNVPDGYGSMDICYVDRLDSGFSEVKTLPAPLNSHYFEAQVTFTQDGTAYFNGYIPGKRWNRRILKSAYINGAYQTPEVLPTPINIMDSSVVDYTPFISMDESYLLFCSNRQQRTEEDCRIYVSFKSDKNVWSKPINLSDRIDFDQDSRDPYVSPDGKYLFFSSGENIYWMDEGIIEELKKETENG